MKKRNADNSNIQNCNSEGLSAEDLEELNRLLERLHGWENLNIIKLKKEKIEEENNEKFEREKSVQINIYEKGSQHIDTQINWGASPPAQASPPAPASPLTPLQLARGTLGERGVDSIETTKGLPEEKARLGEGECLRQKRGGEVEERIRQCIAMLMQERYGKEALFNQQSHWQAVYRILVDKGYCRDSDFDGFDMFIRTVMPEEVNKPYSKGSVKQISQTDFVRPFEEWKYDALTSKTRKPFERMVAVASRFKSILEENRL